MKQYTIAIPEDKNVSFLEFLKSSGIQIIESSESDIPQWHKDLVRDRIATATKQNMLDWESVKKDIRLDE